MNIKDRKDELHYCELAIKIYKHNLMDWKSQSCNCKNKFPLICKKCENIAYWKKSIKDTEFEILSHKSKIDKYYKIKAQAEIRKLKSVMPPAKAPPPKNHKI